jgi:hypothetical protein
VHSLKKERERERERERVRVLLKSREELNIFTRVYVSARFRKVRKVEKPPRKEKKNFLVHDEKFSKSAI